MFDSLTNNDYIAIEVGKIVKTVQYIEYNLVESIRLKSILSIFEKTSTVPNEIFEAAEKEAKDLCSQLGNKTFGQVVTIVKKSEVLELSRLIELEEILKKRNDLVHHYFKRKDFEKHEENIPFIQNEFNYLRKFNLQANIFNDFLCELVDNFQEEYNQIG